MAFGTVATLLRRRRVGLLTIVVSVTVGLIAAYAAGRPARPPDTLPSITVRLGVGEGGSIPAYVASSKTALTQLIAADAGLAAPAPAFALVSMTAYLTPDRLATVVAGLPLQLTYVFLRVPSSQQTQIRQEYTPHLPGDLTREMLAIAGVKANEAAGDTALASASTDTEASREYQREAAVARIEEHAYRAVCACAYAAVVAGKPAVLGTLAARSGVRAVQPAPSGFTPQSGVYLPPFPDQRNIVEPPPSSAP